MLLLVYADLALRGLRMEDLGHLGVVGVHSHRALHLILRILHLVQVLLLPLVVAMRRHQGRQLVLWLRRRVHQQWRGHRELLPAQLLDSILGWVRPLAQ